MENISPISREQRQNLKEIFCSDFEFLVLTEAEDNLGASVTFLKLRRQATNRSSADLVESLKAVLRLQGVSVCRYNHLVLETGNQRYL